jgi:two-component system chemotaxis sensor kinase CheA
MSDEQAIFLLFRSGLSTASSVTELSGRGVGLDVVHENLAAVRGRIDVVTTPGSGCAFSLIVPITMAVTSCMVFEVDGRSFALPLHAIALAMERAHREVVDGQPSVRVHEEWIPCTSMAEVLGLRSRGAGPVVVTTTTTRRHAFEVDRLIGQREVVVTGLSALLPALPLVSGATVEHDGGILLLLDPIGLTDGARRSIDRDGRSDVSRPDEPADPGPRPRQRARLLVVEDSLVVRRLTQAILERAGYEVVTAEDGREGLTQLDATHVDLVLTDIEMPNLDGFGLTEAIRAHPVHRHTPVVVLTALGSDEDRRRGLDAGADGWFVKSEFDEAGLLVAVERLLGR